MSDWRDSEAPRALLYSLPVRLLRNFALRTRPNLYCWYVGVRHHPFD